ncbi:GSCOCG00009382001-RA-CDS [Cotesia congregata]|nr:GSCOCG00009382001-RA-CDS [Cotesia congregata]
MKIISLLSNFILYSYLSYTVKCQRLSDYLLEAHTTTVSHVPYRDRRNKAEPTCEELRAMWRYSKRQSRAVEVTNDLPMYRDPFSYNVWETYPVRSQPSIGYREIYKYPDERDEEARNRGGGRTPVYGKVVHKAPAESRFRNGMPNNRAKAFEEVTRMYGTINRQPPDSRRPQYNFRVGGGGSSISHVPQAGSFQHLKELIRTERARELQDQRAAEELAARAASANNNNNSNDIFKNEQKNSKLTDSQIQYLNSIKSYQEPKNFKFNNYDKSKYVSSLTDFNDASLVILFTLLILSFDNNN